MFTRLLTSNKWIRRLLLQAPLGGEEQATVLYVAYDAALRRPQNWILPGLLGMVLVMALLGYAVMAAEPAHPVMRIIAADYFVLFLGFVGASNTAHRWRTKREEIEEFAVAPLHPSTVANVFFAASFSPWLVVLVAIAIFEWILFVAYNPGILALVFSLPAYLLIALFHLETLRIANSVCGPMCLPGGMFRSQVFGNLILLGLIVLGLTALGSMITGVTYLVLMAMHTVIDRALFSGAGNLIIDQLLWFVSALPGLLAIMFLKRAMARNFEAGFWTRYLMFMAWGVAETNHPADYPPDFRKYANSHVPWLRR